MEGLGSHKRSFERYHPRRPTASPSPRLGFASPPQSQERLKLGTSNLADIIFAGSIRTQDHEKNWRKGSVGVSRDGPQF